MHDDQYVFTAPVGKCNLNEFGLCDMHGNVFEWYYDWLRSDPLSHPQPDLPIPRGPCEAQIACNEEAASFTMSIAAAAVTATSHLPTKL